MECTVDLANIEEYIMSDKFRDFLLSTTTQFGTAAFILQTLLDKLDELKTEENNG